MPKRDVKKRKLPKEYPLKNCLKAGYVPYVEPTKKCLRHFLKKFCEKVVNKRYKTSRGWTLGVLFLVKVYI